MPSVDRFQLEQYKADKRADLSGRLQRKKQFDTDQAWLKTMRARSAESWTQADEDRALSIQRADKVDKRGDVIFAQGQEKVEHGLERRPILEQQQDELSGLNIRGAKARLTQAEKGRPGTLVTSYDSATNTYKRELIDQYTGEATPVASDYTPVQSKRLYDVTSAEVSAWKASNFNPITKMPNKDHRPLDEWVIQMRKNLGGRAAGGRDGGGLQRGRAPLDQRIEQDGDLKFVRAQGTSRTRKPAQKSKTTTTLPGLYEPIP